MRTLLIAFVAGMTCQATTGAHAQTLATPSEAAGPARAGDWRSAGGPILFGGSYFYPSGPTVFFEGSVMVRSGSLDGVPIYIDASRDSANVVYVPVAGGLLRPYERRRADQVADTVLEPSAPPPPVAALTASAGDRSAPPAAVDPTVAAARDGGFEPTAVETARRPHSNRGIWIEFDGKIWVASGAGGAYQPDRFTRIGTFHGFPVYQEPSRADHIYVPSVPGGPVARYSLSDERATRPIE